VVINRDDGWSLSGITHYFYKKSYQHLCTFAFLFIFIYNIRRTWCANNNQKQNTMNREEVDQLSNQFVDRMVNNVALMLKFEQKEEYELAQQYNQVIDDDIDSYISLLEVIFFENSDEQYNHREVVERQKEELIESIRAEFEKNPNFLDY
jgi:hypothetical protein